MHDSVITRRAALLGGSGMAAWLPAAAQSPQAAHTGALRIGLIGTPERTAMLGQRAAQASPLNMTVTAVWDSDPVRAEAFAKSSSVRAVRNPQDMLKAVDGVLISPGASVGAVVEWAEPYLRAGIPVWVDGPMAASMAQAKQMIAAAGRSNTAVMAGSIEEFFVTTLYLRRKAVELAPITAAMLAVSTAGKEKHPWAGAEAVNLLCAIFGPSATKVQRIVASADGGNYAVTFEYRNLKGNRPLHIVAQGIPQTASRMWARLYGMDMVDREHLFSDDPDEDWSHSFMPAALALQEMVRTRKAPQDSTYLLAKTRLYLAACLSSSDPQGKQLAVADLADSWSVGS